MRHHPKTLAPVQMIDASLEPAVHIPLPSRQDGDGLFQVLWRRRTIVLLMLVLSIAAGAAYLLLAPRLYTSTARLYVRENAPGLLPSAADKLAPLDDSYLYAQAEFLRANPILTPVLSRPEISSIAGLHKERDPVGFLKDNLAVSVGKKDHIISVSFDATDPADAANLVNSVVDSYVAFNSSQNRSNATELLDVLRKEKEKRDAQLAGKSKEVFDYKIANGTLSFGADHSNVVVQRLARLSDALTEAELAAVTARSNYDAAKAVIASPGRLRQLIETQHLASGSSGSGSQAQGNDARADLSRMEMQLAVMSGKYKEGHPSLQAMKAAISQRRTQIEQYDREFCEAYLAGAQTTFAAADQKVRDIRSQLAEQQKLALDLNAKAAEYTRLESERARMERLCDALDARIKELDVSQHGGAFNIHVLEPARAALKPSKPARARAMAVALLAGLVLGAGAALLRESRDHRLHSADEVQLTLDLPLLGLVPHIKGRACRTRKGQMVHREPMSPASEAFRTLRTAICYSTPETETRTLLFTSPSPEEGKSTAASNTAIALAQSGRRVLLVDADCRRPTQHLAFELSDAEGLTTLIEGRVSPDGAISPSGIENLDILPCGPIPPNPAELLHSNAFTEVLSSLKERYDHVVIDSPPAASVTDAQILSAASDATILVLRAGSSTRQAARYARDRLMCVGARVLGVLVNDVPSGSADGYYSAGYPTLVGQRYPQMAGASVRVLPQGTGGSR